jgi:hypothetical protein
MDADLAERIIRAYSGGLVDDGPEESALVSEERDDRLRKVLTFLSAEGLLNATVITFKDRAYRIALTQQNHPPFENWAEMVNSEKLVWIAANNGEPYPVLWLKVSRVADYFYYVYNHWVPRGDTGYLDADCNRPPNALWSGHEKMIRQELENHGFSFLTREDLFERTPFVLQRDYDSIPDNDPRWDQEGFEPPLVPSTVHECLFSY